MADPSKDNPTLDKLRKLQNREELAAMVGTTWPHLRHLLFRAPASQRYRTFVVRKRGGGARFINAPASGLKSIQRTLADLLAQIYRPKASVHGFVNGRSIITNASYHQRRQLILNVDLKDFFPSIHIGRVIGVLQKPPYSLPRGTAVLFAQIACCDGKLPQGAPTSPILSNMVCARLDGELARLALQARASYSRYADDLTFSTNADLLPGILGRVVDYGSGRVDLRGSTLEGVIVKNVFAINEDKVRLLSRHHSQLVTGIKVNAVLNVPRRYPRRIRAMLHDWQKNGYEAAEKKHWSNYPHPDNFQTKPSFRRVVHGKLAYLKMVKGADDPLYRKLYTAAERLEARDIGFWRRDSESRLFRPLKPKLPALLRHLLPAVWVIETESDQGTAFSVADGLFVTCAHCTGEKMRLVDPRDSSSTWPLAFVAKNDEEDWAIVSLATAGLKHRSLPIDLTEPDLNSPIHVVGFPDFAPGSTLVVRPGNLIARQKRFGQMVYMADCNILPGNSGGPVINDRNQVIGIAARGPRPDEDNPTQMNWVIPIGRLENELKAAKERLGKGAGFPASTDGSSADRP